MLDFENKIICGDCIEILNGLAEPFADLVFADPPFNIGYRYDKYHDKLKKDKYLHRTADWIKACTRVLKPHGSFYIAIGDDYAANIKIIAEDQCGLFMRNWIIWHYTFGQQTTSKFARAHTHIFYFVRDKNNFTFNDSAVRIPSDRQLIYDDRRANPKGKMPNDVWDSFPRVCGTFKERTNWHPCQMPENLLARIIAVSSKPADLVLDPFIGSGTTAAAACMLDRRYAGIDISEEYVAKANQRIEQLNRQKKSVENIFGSINPGEFFEIRRLCADMNTDAKTLLSDKKMLELFTRQLRLRTGRKNFDTSHIFAALTEHAS